MPHNDLETEDEWSDFNGNEKQFKSHEVSLQKNKPSQLVRT